MIDNNLNTRNIPIKQLLETKSGAMVIDKPKGISSAQAVGRIKYLIHSLVKEYIQTTNTFNQHPFLKKKSLKVGHCGTLDPFATGLLVLCIGRATRLAFINQSAKKRYTGVFRLGVVTDTDDITGQVISESDARHIKLELVSKIIENLTGKIEQTPPRYSAVKINGVRAYTLARKSEEFDIKTRNVEVFNFAVSGIDRDSFQIVNHKESCRYFDFKFDISCSKGTYIRSLARDLGEMLGVGGTVVELRRESSGHLTVPVDFPPLFDSDRSNSSSATSLILEDGFMHWESLIDTSFKVKVSKDEFNRIFTSKQSELGNIIASLKLTQEQLEFIDTNGYNHRGCDLRKNSVIIISLYLDKDIHKVSDFENPLGLLVYRKISCSEYSWQKLFF